jgi:aryl-alcohol dehydrogenase-like predicted oxidoreductase
MGFGKEWNWGADKETSLKILDAYASNGGNFIDTANRYTEGTSEKIIGEFIHSNRDNFILATKYSLHDNLTNVNASGNNRKNMMRSVEESLKRLNTDFIDLFYLHIWDNLTPMDEVLRGLDDLVKQGKVNYIGISDTPAWLVSQAQTMAELMGWSRFVALQVEYSLLQRTPERELIPMAKHYNLTVTPWAPLAGGALTGKYTKGDTGRLPKESKRLNERAVKITEEVIAIAKELNVQPSSVALKWTMQQGFSCIPIIGATKPEQFLENLNCLDVNLSNEQINRLNQISKIELGFPGAFFLEEGVKNVLYGGFFDRIEKR